MKVKSLAANLGTNFGHRIGRGSPLEGRRGPPVVLFSTACLVQWRDSAAFRTGGIPRRSRPACCRGALRTLGFWWARVEDESKRRRQGLVVCRVTLPFEGFCDARPGVTLAPTLLRCGCLPV